MKSTRHTLTKNGLTFTRWHHTGRPSLAERRAFPGATADSFNAQSPWIAFLNTDEIDGHLNKTGEKVGVEIKIWTASEIIKIEGASRYTASDALALGNALQAANQLLKEFQDQSRCPSHGTEDNHADHDLGHDCEACHAEMEAKLDDRDRRTQIAANAFSR
jgi:hypothetical protein